MIDWNRLTPRLHALGFDEIHQSDLSTGRTCRKQLMFYLSVRRRTGGSMKALLGSAFHRLMDLIVANSLDRPMAYASEVELYSDCISHCLTRHPDCMTFQWNGHQVEMFEVLCIMMQRPQNVGLIELAFRTFEILEQEGIQILDQEVHLRRGPLTGSMDILGLGPEGECILDIKTSGMWGAFIENKSPSKQSWTPAQVASLPQLRTYHMMYDKPVASYGIVCPANATSYVKGAKRGQARGETLFLAPAPSLAGVEQDIYEWVESFLSAQPRDYPNHFGKPSCPECPFYQPCIQGANQELPDYGQ